MANMLIKDGVAKRAGGAGGGGGGGGAGGGWSGGGGGGAGGKTPCQIAWESVRHLALPQVTNWNTGYVLPGGSMLVRMQDNHFREISPPHCENGFVTVYTYAAHRG